MGATVQLTDTGEAQVTEYETSSGKDAAEGSLYDQIQAKKQEKYDELRERKKHQLPRTLDDNDVEFLNKVKNAHLERTIRKELETRADYAEFRRLKKAKDAEDLEKQTIPKPKPNPFENIKKKAPKESSFGVVKRKKKKKKKKRKREEDGYGEGEKKKQKIASTSATEGI